MTQEEETEVVEVLAQFEENDLRTRCFPTVQAAQAFRRQALTSDDPVLYYQAQTINLQYHGLPRVFVVWVVREDGRVAVRFRDTEILLDVLRRRGEQGEPIPN